MNESEITKCLAPLSDGISWSARCVRELLQADNLTDVAQGLVAQGGRKPVSLVKDSWNAWGIDLNTCLQYCGRQNFLMV